MNNHFVGSWKLIVLPTQNSVHVSEKTLMMIIMMENKQFFCIVDQIMRSQQLAKSDERPNQVKLTTSQATSHGQKTCNSNTSHSTIPQCRELYFCSRINSCVSQLAATHGPYVPVATCHHHSLHTKCFKAVRPSIRLSVHSSIHLPIATDGFGLICILTQFSFGFLKYISNS